MGSSTKTDLAATIAVAALGVGLVLYHGRVGFMPLDQSIVFDGAWRVLQGQVPLRDFTAPSGLTPILIQALFFKALGVSWFAYCLHAATANGLFGALAYRLLLRLSSSRPTAFACAAASTVVFYPPFGVPYMDQHAFFFGFVFVVLLAGAVLTPRRSTCRLAMVSMPPVLVVAWLSKPIPTLFFLPLLGLTAFAASGPRRRDQIGWLGISLGSVLLGLAAVGWGLGIEPGRALDALVVLPASAGEARLHSLMGLHAVGALWKTGRAWGLVSVGLAAALGAWALARGALRRGEGARSRAILFPALLSLGLLAVCALFTILTKNEAENGIPFVFVALGLAQAAVRRSGVTWTPRIATGALIAVALVDAARFEARVNGPRLVLGLEDTTAPAPRPSLPPPLAFMDWRDPAFGGYGASDLTDVVEFFDRTPGNFLLVGDASILYALTGRPSVNPVLWFHPRLTLPGHNTAGFQDYQARLLDGLERHDVRYVVVEMNGTFMGARPAYFPALVEYIQRRIVDRHAFGAFDVIELGSAREPTGRD